MMISSKNITPLVMKLRMVLQYQLSPAKINWTNIPLLDSLKISSIKQSTQITTPILKKYYGETEYHQNLKVFREVAPILQIAQGRYFNLISTLVDLYLVSPLDRSQIVGRPILYVVMDTVSQVLAGFSVTLQNPSAEVSVSSAIEYGDK